MTPQPSDYPNLPTVGGPSRHRLGRSGGRWRPLAVVVGLALLTLACASGGPASNRVAMLTRLPTLTRTPLPTLTPTASNPSPTAARVIGEIAATALPQTASLADDAAPSAEISSTGEEIAIDAMAGNLTTEQELVLTAGSNDGVAGQTAQPDSAVALTTAAATAPAGDLPTTTATRTPTATASGTPLPTHTSTATPTKTPSPTRTPTSTRIPTATPIRQGWVFSGVRTATDPDSMDLVLYGELLNDTGTAQALDSISGSFYDAKGKVISTGSPNAETPFDIIPQSGQLPFKLTVAGLRRAADFDLAVKATPSDEVVRRGFKFANFKPAIQAGDYCFSGKIEIAGDALHSYLTVVAILYDKQDNVINFDQDEQAAPGNQTLDFELCVDSLQESVGRFDLRAWGQ